MTTAAAELLTSLRGQGFTLATEGDRIRVCPSARLTAELRELIRRHKPELLATLVLEDTPTACLTLPPAPRSTLPTEPLPDPDALDSSAVAPDLPDLLADLQREVDSLMDVAWANAWAERLRTARYADLDAVRRSVRLMLDLAAECHRADDDAGFQSWRRFISRHVRGELWDDAACRPPLRAEDFEITA